MPCDLGRTVGHLLVELEAFIVRNALELSVVGVEHDWGAAQPSDTCTVAATTVGDRLPAQLLQDTQMAYAKCIQARAQVLIQ